MDNSPKKSQMSTRKRCKVVHSEGREIIANIIEKCDEEKVRKLLLIPLKNPTARAATYSGVPLSTIVQIRNEYAPKKNSLEESYQGPKKKKTANSHCEVHVDAFDKCVIRDAIQNFYIQEKSAPTLSRLLPIIKEKINFPGGRTTLRHVIQSMGFKWRRCQSKHKLLVERHNVVERRSQYFVKIKQYRKEGHCVFYIGDTWVDNNLTFQNCKQGNDVHNKDRTDSSNKLIILLVGGLDGVLSNTLLTYMAGSVTGEYSGLMSSENFEKWTVKQLLPNLPAQSVVVVESKPYNSAQNDKPPTPYSLKKDMMSWLQSKGIPYHEEMSKTELYRLIQPLKTREKCYKFDCLLSGYGHTVLRLPQDVSNLNPIESVWCKIRNILKDGYVIAALSLEELQRMTVDAITQVTKDEWSHYCQNVQCAEEEYWAKDGLVSDIIDDIILNPYSDSESGSDSSYVSSNSPADSESE